MKILSQPLFPRPLLALGLSCTLAALPLCLVRAQEGTPAAPPTTAQAVPDAPKSAGEANPNGANPDAKPMPAKAGVKTMLTAKEKQFIRKAEAGSAAEVQLAELVLKKSENAKIKEFAQMMITDHTAANKELLQLGSDKGIANAKVEVRPEEKAIYARMTAVTGTTFDDGYVKHAVADHETDVKEYKAAIGMTKDADLKAYEEKTLTIIEGHLKMAKELKDAKAATKS